MTENEAMESPLHEVCWKLDAVDSALRNPLLKYSTIEGGIQVFEEMKSMLRRVLLERCARVEGKHGSYTEFGIVAGEIWSTYRNCDGERTTVGRADSGILARNMAAAFSFWAWELEQREKDGSKVQA